MRPRRILVLAVVVGGRLIVDQTEDPQALRVEWVQKECVNANVHLFLKAAMASTHDQQQRRRHQPARAEVQRRTLAGHLLDVLRQAAHAVEPGDRNDLEEGQEHDRYGGRIVIDQLEVVDAALYQVGQAEEEGHTADDQHEQLVVDELVLDPVGEAVLDGRDHHFDDGELRRIC